MSREARLWFGALAALVAFTAFMLVVGNLGETRPEADPIPVAELLEEPAPVYVVGWYAELAGDCVGDDGGADASVAWLQRDCPLRVLVPEQPTLDVSQAELESGLRLAAPLGNVFPSRAEPGGPNLRGQQLVFVGHFDDEAAAGCVPERADRCRNTFVVVDYDEQVR